MEIISMPYCEALCPKGFRIRKKFVIIGAAGVSVK